MRDKAVILRVSFSLATIALATGGVSAQTSQPTPGQIEFFEKRVRPLLAEHCYRCHSSEAKKVKGDFLLDTGAGLRKGGASGPAIVPGKPDDSLLVKAIRYDGELRMPPNAKLSTGQIADLEAWIKMGAPDPREGKVTMAAKKPGIDIEEGKKFWSLQPVKAESPPVVNDAGWPITPIDPFVLAKLESKGLRPAPPAEPRTLLRRLYFDLIGLPPTPEEVQQFVAAWESAGSAPGTQYSVLARRNAVLARTVDRLLDSPAYGERWGRHWLDVVRYADTAGDNSDYPIPQMFKYRDWVIDAVNRDMPYDQFVREQLAGDLIPAASEEERRDKITATGYLANSRRHGSYEDARYPWHLTIEDTIDNFSRAFLGFNLGCARCHDHKFDPFTAEDYYALYGFFSSTRYPWPGIELEKYQRDLVPLAPAAEVEKFTKARQQKIAELDTAIKRLEADKGPAEAIKAAKKEREQIGKAPLPFEMAYAVIDGQNAAKQRIGQVGNARVQLKGDPDYPDKEVPRRFPTVLGGQTLSPDGKGSGRLQLAQWLTDPANPLFARVMVNRLWQHHFGRGIVATPNDFGKQGRPPTHPELLDYLAKRFIDSGWSVKTMHRLIVLSATYQQADSGQWRVDIGQKADAVDPDNEYLWHFARRRLDAEVIRDSLLAVSGSLDRSRGGPHPFPDAKTWDFTQHKPFKAVYETNRRSVYLMTQRIVRHPFLALFDGPDTNASTATRTTSTTSLQALFLMNDPFVHEQARKFAARLLAECSDDAARIERAFLLLFARPPTRQEREQSAEFLAHVMDSLAALNATSESRTMRAWESFARALFMSNEFVYVN